MIEEMLAAMLFGLTLTVVFSNERESKRIHNTIRLLVEASKAKDLYELKSIDAEQAEVKQSDVVPTDTMDDTMFTDFLKRQLNKNEEDDSINQRD